jgi:hypothetical protein
MEAFDLQTRLDCSELYRDRALSHSNNMSKCFRTLADKILPRLEEYASLGGVAAHNVSNEGVEVHDVDGMLVSEHIAYVNELMEVVERGQHANSQWLVAFRAKSVEHDNQLELKLQHCIKCMISVEYCLSIWHDKGKRV